MEKNTKKAKTNKKNSVKTPMTPANNSKGGMLRRGNKEGLGGRPLGSPNRKNIIQELLDMDAPESLLTEVRKLNPSAKTLRDINTVSMFNRSLKGNPKAMEMMMYYDIGKPKEVIEHEGNINLGLTPEMEIAVKILNERNRNKE
jgi:hypothetical protein